MKRPYDETFYGWYEADRIAEFLLGCSDEEHARSVVTLALEVNFFDFLSPFSKKQRKEIAEKAIRAAVQA